MRGPTKRELEEDCEALLDLLEDVIHECATQGCLLSADLNQRVDEWLGPLEEGGEEDVIEVIPER